MKNPLRSSYSTEGRRMAGARALWRANGLKEEQFGKPIIAIVNSFTQFVPGHVHLHEIVQHLDVRFFPSDGRPQEQCRETAQTLTLLLRRTESLRGSNLSWEITDEVLHFFADYRQFVREIPEDIPMENLQTTVGTED